MPPEAGQEHLPPALVPPKGQERVLGLVHRLMHNPPQVLVLEGGCEEDRLALGLYWAAGLNCTAPSPPCLTCSLCRQIQAQGFRDLYVFSGVESSIKIEEVRTVRPVMGQRPDQGKIRVILLHQAQELTVSAANSLLKAMEEPLPGNVFVLLAPLRTWLLPTLVSRSFVLTLSWPSGQREEVRDEILAWQQTLVGFWQTGQGLFEHTAKKGNISKALVQEILVSCQQALLRAMQGRDRGHELAAFLARSLDAEKMSSVDLMLHKGQQALRMRATPGLVVDWVAVQIWSLVRAGTPQGM